MIALAYQALLAEDVLAVEQGGAPVVVVADGTGAAGTGGLQLFGTRRSAETLKWGSCDTTGEMVWYHNIPCNQGFKIHFAKLEISVVCR